MSLPRFERSLSPDARVALLLNGNARRVTPRLLDTFRPFFAEGDIFFTRSLEEGEKACEEIYKREYDLVLSGGGDGSLLHCITQITGCHERFGQSYRLPAVGILPLGTGNGVAHVLGSTAIQIPRLHTYLRSGGVTLRPASWIRVLDRLTPFAGVGYDSQILHDYKRLSKALSKTPLRWFGQGLVGYMLALLGITTPRTLLGAKTYVRVFNEGSCAWKVGADGQILREYGPGEILYEGPQSVASVGSFPYFGFHFKMFPHADGQEKVQLRITDLSPLVILWNLRAVWQGRWSHPRLHDFLIETIRVEYPAPEPLQIGGDPAGLHQEIVYEKVQSPINLAYFSHGEPPGSFLLKP